jgi:antitoxin CptB
MTENEPVLTDLEKRRKRLKFQCWHRGFKEIDLILGHFADRYLGDLSEQEITDLEALLSLPDQQIYEWLTGKDAVTPTFDTGVFGRIRKMDYLSETMWAQVRA